MKRIVPCLLVFGLIGISGCSDKAKVAFEKGVAASRQGDFAAAILGFDEAIRLNPQFTDAYYCRAQPRPISAITTRLSPIMTR